MSEISPSLRTGVKSIDIEHAQLMAFQRRLADFCPRGLANLSCDCDESTRSACNESITDLFSDILVFMVDHFRHEEQLMRGLATDHVVDHRQAHEDISLRFSMLADRKVAAPLLVSPAELSEIVGHWLTEHIVEWDMVLAAKLFERGDVAAPPTVR